MQFMREGFSIRFVFRVPRHYSSRSQNSCGIVGAHQAPPQRAGRSVTPALLNLWFLGYKAGQ